MKLKPYPEYKDSGVESIGDIPEDWDLYRLKFLLSNLESGGREKGGGNTLEKGVFSLGGEHINWNGTLKLDNVRLISEEYYNSMQNGKIKIGDIVLVKDGATIGKTAIIDEMKHEKMAVNEHVFLIRPNKKIIPKLLYYLICSDTCFVQIKLTETGSAQGGINQDFPGKVFVTIPNDLQKQKSIVNFLDKKTSEIDKTIEKDTRLIELLQEKRTALINHVVTKGLDPEAPMKDSGIEWIGEIPEHWKVKRSKHLFKEINRRSKGNDENLLSVSHITGVTLRSEKPEITMFLAETTEGYKLCEIEDLVINTMWAWMGAMGFSNYKGIVSPSYNVYRFKMRCLKADYYDKLFRTPRFTAEVIRWSKGIWTSRLRLYPEGFFKIYLPVPPENEQIEIGNFINNEIKKINRLESSINKGILLLEEYKKSLIHHVVTGKVDVREVV